MQTFPALGGKQQISSNGGYFLAWRRDGTELFYVSSDKKMMAVDVKERGATLKTGEPKALFDVRVPSFNEAVTQFAVTADGQKFLVAKSIAENTSIPIAVVMNWTADLKR